MKSKDIRRTFLEYFEKNGHKIIPSSSLIPAEDPTLLFTNAGMNQFKDLFLGKESRSYKRATSSQKCVRAGGKHNDLEQVGFTARHLTFFEMLGNFSFGDYFKKEAILFAWELLTTRYNIPAEKLYASIFREDNEAFDIWHTEIGLPKERIIRLDEKDNFWAMGDTGPCGPCSEIYFDQGAEIGCESKTCAPGCDCDRFIEIWNLVFMQCNRSRDGSMQPLNKTGIDTGMGLERLCSILQNKKNVFHTDLFDAQKHAIELETATNYDISNQQRQAAINVVCDHVRSASLLITDGCSPANDGRRYVLRKIIRRGILFAQKLSSNDTLLITVARAFITDQHDVFPELKTNESLIFSILEQEIDRFSKNLKAGQLILDKYLAETKNNALTTLSGDHAFKLYDTYGFPLELTKVIAHEKGFSVDTEGFEHKMATQQAQSKQQERFSHTIPFPEDMVTTFVGYETIECSTPILWEYTDENERWIIAKESPFYAESGGQVSDNGIVTINEYSYHVVDLKKVGAAFKPAIAIKLSPVKAMGTCTVGDTAHCIVDSKTRINTIRNHTATHMVHAALHELLGPQAKQAGSVVNKDYLRLDYTHHKALSSEQLHVLENRVNEKIWENIAINSSTMTLADAKKKGVVAFFGEKYNPESVRVVSIPGFSQELCGGTHAKSTGVIGCFKIISDSALATGTRRLIAITGPKALELFQQTYRDLKVMGEQFKAKVDEVIEAVAKQTKNLQHSQKELKQVKRQLLHASIDQFLKQIKTSGSYGHAAIILENVDMDDLRTIAQRLGSKQPGFYFVASNNTKNHKGSFVALTTSKTIHHNAVVRVLREHNLRGGGKPGLIQGGGAPLTQKMAEQIVQQVITES